MTGPPLWDYRLKWQDVVKKQSLNGGSDWKARAADSENGL